jgi:hypothetical protein
MNSVTNKQVILTRPQRTPDPKETLKKAGPLFAENSGPA